MVKSLYGKCNGDNILFSPNAETGRWETTVPASAGGTYIIELYATDDAGNTAYFATVKVEFDTSQLCMKISIVAVGERWSMEEVAAVLSGTPIRFETDKTDVRSVCAFDRRVLSKIIRCEVCGR